MRYVEEWWEGGGNSGPCLEVILEGVELATLVFMMYRETPQGRIPMDMTVVDTGYGLERLTWISQGTPSAYEAVFGPVVQGIQDEIGMRPDARILAEYSKVAGMLNMRTAADVRALREQTAERLGISYEELLETVEPMERIYVVCDHTRALAFMINDGVVPSNVREGYFARMLIRRALRAMHDLDMTSTLADVVGQQIDYFSPHFPELVENRDGIIELINVEEQRYHETLERGRSIVQRMNKELKGQPITTKQLIELYDSHGLNPEVVQEFSDAPVDIPDTFYQMVAEKHEEEATAQSTEERNDDYPEDMPSTVLGYYEDPEVMSFRAEVVAIVKEGIILDHTYFYPEGGGQEADHGIIDNHVVTDVQKVRNTVLHFVDDLRGIEIGQIVTCSLDESRRRQLMRQHTAAHIINGVAREMLGNHVWQSGAHKSVGEARLDITHYENLSEEQRDELERRCNELVLEDHPVEIQFMQRDEAESEFGFRLYQGGVVPGKIIRVVNTVGIDVEACGGLHCDRTSHVGPIRILRTRRIQDGVVRIEYTAGLAAVSEMQLDRTCIDQLAECMMVPRESVVPAATKMLSELKEERKRVEIMTARLNESMADMLLSQARDINNVKVVVHQVSEGDEVLSLVTTLISNPGVVAVIGAAEPSVRVIIGRSKDVELDARPVLKDIMKVIGGGGGGKPDLAQGGGGDPLKVSQALKSAIDVVKTAMTT